MAGETKDCAQAASELGIGLIGAEYGGKVVKKVVYRSSVQLEKPTSYPCIVAANEIDLALGANLITVTNFRRVKDRLRKKLRKGQGLEFLFHSARAMSGVEVAKWLGDLREASELCQALGVQFILSSGARSISELVSGSCFDEILKEIDIDPRLHWDELNGWLDRTISGQVTV